MIRITITAAAFEAIDASSVGVEQNSAPSGDYFIWLDPRFVDRLRAMRPGRELQRPHCTAGGGVTEPLVPGKPARALR
jgi:hypothetical protein